LVGQDQSDARCLPVDGGDDRLGKAEVKREVGVEFGANAVTRVCQWFTDAGIVAAFFNMAFERLGIRPGAKAAAGAGDDDYAYVTVLLGLFDAPAIFGVHAPGPGVQAAGPIEGDGRDAVIDCVGGRFEVHVHWIVVSLNFGMGNRDSPKIRA